MYFCFSLVTFSPSRISSLSSRCPWRSSPVDSPFVSYSDPACHFPLKQYQFSVILRPIECKVWRGGGPRNTESMRSSLEASMVPFCSPYLDPLLYIVIIVCSDKIVPVLSRLVVGTSTTCFFISSNCILYAYWMNL